MLVFIIKYIKKKIIFVNYIDLNRIIIKYEKLLLKLLKLK